jgi:hypothetical protein
VRRNRPPEPQPLGVGLDEIAHALVREPPCAESAALGNGPKQRAFADAGGLQPRIYNFHKARRDAMHDRDRLAKRLTDVRAWRS